jgi:hypothetical protein
MEETDKAYLAGLLDGEGCIYIVSFTPKDTGRPRVIPSVSIGMHSKKAVEFFSEKVGKSLLHPYKTLGNRGTWTCRLNYKDAADFLECIMPYLITKKPQAQFFTFFYSIAFSRSYRGGGNSVPEHIVKLRSLGADILSLLNNYDDAPFNSKADELSELLSHKMAEFRDMMTLSQASEGEGSEEGATTRELSPNNNTPHERPPLTH